MIPSGSLLGTANSQSLRYGYASSVQDFLKVDDHALVGELSKNVINSGFDSVSGLQIDSWPEAIQVLREQLGALEFQDWFIVLEHRPLRVERRSDVIILSPTIVFVIEFKIGARRYDSAARWQALDYARDLRDYHVESRDRRIVPILCATNATWCGSLDNYDLEGGHGVTDLVCTNGSNLAAWFRKCSQHPQNEDISCINAEAWLASNYCPTPNIIESAKALYEGHTAREISHSYAEDLDKTIEMLAEEVRSARLSGHRTICFVTGVPGAGKTLTGLEIVHDTRVRGSDSTIAVFLSGNGPLVKVIRKAVAHSQSDPSNIGREGERTVKNLIENVHQFLGDHERSTPPEHVIVFDEAQRAWDAAQMRKKKRGDKSEPERVLQVMERLPSWSVVIALVGGGQEIFDGEAGLTEWGRALSSSPIQWRVVCADEALTGGHSVAGNRLFEHDTPTNVELCVEPRAHLNVVVRSPRAQQWAQWVNEFLSLDTAAARDVFRTLQEFPCFTTRNLDLARDWLRWRHHHARTERIGLVATSKDARLRAYGIERSSRFLMNYPIEHWYLANDDDVRSSVWLEVAASEFECQGLELDWVGLCWGGDLLPTVNQSDWEYRRFWGNDWQRVNKTTNQGYTKNRYRVLLTRARKGLVIWVPPGDRRDPTRNPEGFDRVFDALQKAGVPLLEDNSQLKI